MDDVAEALAQGDCLSGSDTDVTLETNLQIHFFIFLQTLFGNVHVQKVRMRKVGTASMDDFVITMTGRLVRL